MTGTRRIPAQPYLVDDVLHALQTHGDIPIPAGHVRDMVARNRLGVTDRSVQSALQSLSRRGLVVKVSLGGRRVAWKAADRVWPRKTGTDE